MFTLYQLAEGAMLQSPVREEVSEETLNSQVYETEGNLHLFVQASAVSQEFWEETGHYQAITNSFKMKKQINESRLESRTGSLQNGVWKVDYWSEKQALVCTCCQTPSQNHPPRHYGQRMKMHMTTQELVLQHYRQDEDDLHGCVNRTTWKRASVSSCPT